LAEIPFEKFLRDYTISALLINSRSEANPNASVFNNFAVSGKITPGSNTTEGG
jgi:hypothetical protein